MRLVVFLLLLASSTVAAEVEVSRLDGTTLAGELKSWTGEQVVISAGGVDQVIPQNELFGIRNKPTEGTSGHVAATSPVFVELHDGTLIPTQDFQISAKKATVELATPAATGSASQAVQLTRDQLAMVRLQPMDESLESQWEEIRKIDLVADALVLLKKNGTSLDYVEGVLGDVTGDKVEFELEGDPMKIDRKKVAGLIYFRRDKKSGTDPRFLLRGWGGLTAQVRNAKIAGDKLELITISGAQLSWPIDAIESADFSAGKLVYLSDMPPAAKSVAPLIALPTGVTFGEKYVEPRFNQSAFGGPLTLATTQSLAEPAASEVQSFSKGIAMRSRTELVYRLPTGYRRLVGIAGIEPAVRMNGNVHLAVYADDRPLLETDIVGGELPRPIELDVDGAKRLKIVADYGQNLDTGDWLNLCDLKLIK